MTLVAEAVDLAQSDWNLLQDHWRAAVDLWDDPVRRRFEREFWLELEATVPPALEEMARLEAVMDQALRQDE